MLKKIIVSVLVLLIFSSSFLATSIKAQEGNSWYDQNFNEWYAKVYDTSNPSEIFGERYTAAQVEWILYGLFAFVINKTTGDPQTTSCLMNNDIQDCASRLKDFLTRPETSGSQKVQPENVASEIFNSNRSLSGIAYVKSTAQKLHLIPEAEAQTPTQGFGFQALNPVLDMWKATRDIAFGFLVLAIVVLSFMIMFRVKISPQIVITAQSALPKIVIAAVLITFSYAIAGFIVDIMYVAIGLFSLVGRNFFPWGIRPDTSFVFSFLTKGQIISGLDFQLGIIFSFAIYIILFVIAFLILLFFKMGAVVSGVTVLLTSATGLLPIIGILLAIILILALLYFFVKTIWTLLKAFAMILILTIFAPLQLMLGVLFPDLGFWAWVRSLVSNLSVFVVTGVLYFLSFIFLFQGFALGVNDVWGGNFGSLVVNLFFGTTASGAISNLINPGTQTGWPPLLGGGSTSIPILFLGVSFVFFALIPKSADIIKSMIEKRPFTYGAEIGGGAKVAGVAGLGAVKRIAGGKAPIPGFGEPNEKTKKAAEVIEGLVSGFRNTVSGRDS